MTLFAILALGFFLGMRHATDSDHVIAVTTIVSRARSARAALWVGALWGLGHSATILTVGGAIVLFGWVIPPRLGLSMEMSVAVMLIVLGAMNLSGALSRINQLARRHQHAGDEEEASVPHAHVRGPLRPLVIGVVHGLAGSAAVTLLVLTTITSAGMALFYLAIFGAGTVAGMMLLTLAMALPISLLSRRFANAEQLMARVTGLVSIAFGLFLAYRIGVADGLLFGVPHWSPH
jgi:high-affinity nickel-transport protein